MINALKCAHHQSRHQLPYKDRMHCVRARTHNTLSTQSVGAGTQTLTLTNAQSRMSDFVKSAYQQSNSEAIESVTRFFILFFSSPPFLRIKMYFSCVSLALHSASIKCAIIMHNKIIIIIITIWNKNDIEMGGRGTKATKSKKKMQRPNKNRACRGDGLTEIFLINSASSYHLVRCRRRRRSRCCAQRDSAIRDPR